MLEKVDLTKKLSKEEYKEKMPPERMQSTGDPDHDRF